MKVGEKKDKSIAIGILIGLGISVIIFVLFANWDVINSETQAKQNILEDIEHELEKDKKKELRPDSLYIKQLVSVNPEYTASLDKGIIGVKPFILKTQVVNEIEYFYYLIGCEPMISSRVNVIYTNFVFGDKDEIDAIMCSEMDIATERFNIAQKAFKERDSVQNSLNNGVDELNKKTCK